MSYWEHCPDCGSEDIGTGMVDDGDASEGDPTQIEGAVCNECGWSGPDNQLITGSEVKLRRTERKYGL